MKVGTISQAALVAVAVLGLASTAHAQATRTWVSGVGDDVNPCSRTAPCKTFAGAISKTAAGGFINVLDSGGFGAVTITKSLTIDGEGSHAGVLASLTNGIIINGLGIKVTLRNLAIESPSNANAGLDGVRVLQAAEVHVEKCWISGFSSDGIDFNPSGGGDLFVEDTTISNVTGNAVAVTQGRGLIQRLNAQSNGAGVLVNGFASATVRASVAAGGGIGFGVTVSAAALMNLEDSTASHNTHGVMAESGGTVRVSNSFIVSNTANGLLNSGGASFLVSLEGNSVAGNSANGAFTSTQIKQ
jgi:parallel beta helix pectate lyase-like protein